jgi:hypothetical protein
MMATTKRPRRAAGSAPAQTADEQATPTALTDMPADHSAPTLAMAADDPMMQEPEPAPAARSVADGPTLIQPAPAASAFNTPLIEPSSQPASAAARAAAEQSLASERAAMTQRRTLIIGGLAVLVLIGGLLAYRLLMPGTPAQIAPVDQPTAAPAAQAQPTVAPAQPTAAPVAQAQPTVAPAQPTAAPVAQVQPTVAPAIVTCADVAGLPVFGDTTCVDHDTDLENGLTEIENTYRTNSAAADVGRFYEGAFASNGWVLQEFSYAVELGARSLQVDVEVQQTATGPLTEIRLTERGAAAGAITSTTCTAIDGLPAFANATCSEFDTDQENGLVEIENTYTTSASPEEIRSFYANVFTQSGWAVSESSYGLTQGQRILTVDIDPETAATGAYTQIKVTAK